MILINLLPPEMRKRAGGVSPVFLSVVAGGGSCLLLLLLWLYIIFIRIPNADSLIAENTTVLAQKTVEADKVLAIEKQIKEAEDRRDQIVGLMLRKVYWARALDDFATLLNGPFTVEGFDVRCQEINISQTAARPGPKRAAGATRGKEPDSVLYKLTWRYKMVFKDTELSGDYIKSFFDTVKASPFWNENGFIDKPEKSYAGDKKEARPKIGKTIIQGSLDWERLKLVEIESARKR